MTEAIREYIHKRLEGLEKLLPENVSRDDHLVNVEVGKTSNHHKSGDIFRAEVSMIFEGRPLYAVSELHDLYSAIDDVRDEIVAEVKKVKDKRRSAIRRGGHKTKEFIKKFFKK